MSIRSVVGQNLGYMFLLYCWGYWWLSIEVYNQSFHPLLTSRRNLGLRIHYLLLPTGLCAPGGNTVLGMVRTELAGQRKAIDLGADVNFAVA